MRRLELRARVNVTARQTTTAESLAAPRTDALSWACAVADVAATTPRLLRAGATGACHGYRVRRTML